MASAGVTSHSSLLGVISHELFSPKWNRELVGAVIYFSVLLEFSRERINQDVAMAAIVQLGYRLKKVSADSQADLIRCIEEVSVEYEDKRTLFALFLMR